MTLHKDIQSIMIYVIVVVFCLATQDFVLAVDVGGDGGGRAGGADAFPIEGVVAGGRGVEALESPFNDH